MAQSYLIFDFGANEQAAQQARHRIEGWKQAFRLDKRMQLKFERRAAEESSGSEPATSKKKSTEAKAESPEAVANERIRLIVRLDFSDHEKLSHQRWLERIPLEEPFKEATPQIIRHDEDGFSVTAELFDSLP